MERLKERAEPLTESADPALGKAPDAADLRPPSDRPRTESFIDHLLAMPDVGDDADFDLPRAEPSLNPFEPA